jgi:probable F420-dependent oxidoreductase
VHISITVPTDDLSLTRSIYSEIEAVGYDRAFSFEAKHDPFLPLAVAAEHTSRLELGTAIAIAFARTPMTLANIGWDLQALTGGRFVLGLGTQIAPHITQRFSMPWSEPVARLREMVAAIRAIWRSWETGERLSFAGRYYTHTRMIPAFDPGPNPFGAPRILTAGFGPQMTALAGECADGFLVHPLNTRRSLEQLTMPAIAEGLARVGRSRSDIEITAVTIVVTGRSEEEFVRSREAVREQLAFYGTTPGSRMRSHRSCGAASAASDHVSRRARRGRRTAATTLRRLTVRQRTWLADRRHIEFPRKRTSSMSGIHEAERRASGGRARAGSA